MLEYLAFKLSYSVIVLLNYCPPKHSSTYFSELSELLTISFSLSSYLLFCGDVEQPNCKNSDNFLSLLDCHHIAQHVSFPTHCKVHILDLVCSSGLSISTLHSSVFPLSDHMTIWSQCFLFHYYLLISLKNGISYFITHSVDRGNVALLPLMNLPPFSAQCCLTP